MAAVVGMRFSSGQEQAINRLVQAPLLPVALPSQSQIEFVNDAVGAVKIVSSHPIMSSGYFHEEPTPTYLDFSDILLLLIPIPITVLFPHDSHRNEDPFTKATSISLP